MNMNVAQSFWNTFIGQLSIELLGGIIGGLIFLFIVLLAFRPKVSICDFICVSQPDGMQDTYFFKFVNKSFFAAHDINIELFSVKKIPMGGGSFNQKLDKLELLLSHVSHIRGRPALLTKKLDNRHCLVVRCHVNLNEILRIETNAILFKVSLKHGLTGLAEVFEQEYGNEEDIRKGKFKPGTKFGSV